MTILGADADWVKLTLPDITAVIFDGQEDTHLLSMLLEKHTEETTPRNMPE